MDILEAHDFNDYDNVLDDIMDSKHPEILQCVYGVPPVASATSKGGFELLLPFLSWTPSETIQLSIEKTTQYLRGRVSDNSRQH